MLIDDLFTTGSGPTAGLTAYRDEPRRHRLPRRDRGQAIHFLSDFLEGGAGPAAESGTTREEEENRGDVATQDRPDETAWPDSWLSRYEGGPYAGPVNSENQTSG